MSTQRQEQASGKARQRRQLRERRFLILGIALLFLLGGAAMWILNSLVYWLLRVSILEKCAEDDL